VIDEFARAVVLGIVQAVTEFLPISSSGHLVLAAEVVGRSVDTLTFDVALHLGTMVAVIGYFWRDWARMAGAVLYDLARHGPRMSRWSHPSRLALSIACATLPAVAAGFLLQDVIDERLRRPEVVVATLIGFALVIGALDAWGGTVGRLADMDLPRAFVVGIAQAVALVPGVSRSGITIAAARGLGFDRPTAARFSFLLSAPAVLGAGVLQFAGAMREPEPLAWGPLLVGAGVAAVAGALVIRGFLAFVSRRTLALFVWYRIALGLATLVAILLGAL